MWALAIMVLWAVALAVTYWALAENPDDQLTAEDLDASVDGEYPLVPLTEEDLTRVSRNKQSR
jgi:hypothetical protein